MNINYGVIGSGTSAERLILWGAGFPVIEVSVEGSSQEPLITLIGDESLEAPIEIDFTEAQLVSFDKHPAQDYEEPLREACGWRVGNAISGLPGMYVIDPSDRYSFELIVTEQSLRLSLRTGADAEELKVVEVDRDRLHNKGAWPVMPTAQPLAVNA